VSNGYQVDWGKALAAGLVLTIVIWASGRLFPGRRAAPLLGAAVGVAALILASYLSWRFNHH
jgi:hypothetical protein